MISDDTIKALAEHCVHKSDLKSQVIRQLVDALRTLKDDLAIALKERNDLSFAVERLRAENATLDDDCDGMALDHTQLVQQVLALEDAVIAERAKLAKAIAALEWYATASYTHASLGVHNDDCYTCDNGDRARQTLEDIGND